MLVVPRGPAAVRAVAVAASRGSTVAEAVRAVAAGSGEREAAGECEGEEEKEEGKKRGKEGKDNDFLIDS